MWRKNIWLRTRQQVKRLSRSNEHEIAMETLVFNIPKTRTRN